MDEEAHTTSAFEDNLFWFTDEQRALIDLMKLCYDINAPDFAFEDILKWAQRSYVTGFDFVPTHGFTKECNLK